MIDFQIWCEECDYEMILIDDLSNPHHGCIIYFLCEKCEKQITVKIRGVMD